MDERTGQRRTYPRNGLLHLFLVIRSQLIASKDGLTTYEISNFYKDYFKEVNLYFFGHMITFFQSLGKNDREIEDWLDTQTNLCSRSRNIQGITVWHAVTVSSFSMDILSYLGILTVGILIPVV